LIPWNSGFVDNLVQQIPPFFATAGFAENFAPQIPQLLATAGFVENFVLQFLRFLQPRDFQIVLSHKSLDLMERRICG
jgi:hypothetical protein